MRSICLSISILLVCLAIGFAQDAPAVRTWTTADGLFKVEAEFVSAIQESVELKRKSDGKTITVPLVKLSPADREWISANANKAEAKEEEPEIPKPNKSFPIEPKTKEPTLKVTAQQVADDFAADAKQAEKKYAFPTVARVEGLVEKVVEVERDGRKVYHLEMKTTGRKVLFMSPVYWDEFASTRKSGQRVAVVSQNISESDAPKGIAVSGADFVKVK